MPQSLAQIYIHLVFWTKNRRASLIERVRDPMHRYLVGICKNQHSTALIVGGVSDHVHLLCRLGKSTCIADLVWDLKRDSTKWIKSEHAGFADFYWQEGYGAFSISPQHVDALIQYIANQEAHHRTETFQDELRRLCVKYGVEIDERFAWD